MPGRGWSAMMSARRAATTPLESAKAHRTLDRTQARSQQPPRPDGKMESDEWRRRAEPGLAVLRSSSSDRALQRSVTYRSATGSRGNTAPQSSSRPRSRPPRFRQTRLDEGENERLNVDAVQACGTRPLGITACDGSRHERKEPLCDASEECSRRRRTLSDTSSQEGLRNASEKCFARSCTCSSWQEAARRRHAEEGFASRSSW